MYSMNQTCFDSYMYDLDIGVHTKLQTKELLAIRRIFSLVDMITNTKFSNCPNVFKIGVVLQ